MRLVGEGAVFGTAEIHRGFFSLVSDRTVPSLVNISQLPH